MTVSDANRRDLYERFTQVLGQHEADTLMELLPPVGWNDVARRGDIAELRGEMAELRGEIAELRGKIDGVNGRMDSMFAKVVAANFASMVALVGLLFGAGAL